jgi:hypothetical protein
MTPLSRNEQSGYAAGSSIRLDDDFTTISVLDLRERVGNA